MVMVSTALLCSPAANADNKRLNGGVVTNVYTIQQQAGCPTALAVNPKLQLAAQRHALDLLDHRALFNDNGSDNSSPQDRAAAAGFQGQAVETVAINPALAISGIEVMNQWFADPVALAIMRDCSNTAIGVWSENSFDRTVVVAVYGQPE
jgi:uncharacterized protein YkwD